MSDNPRFLRRGAPTLAEVMARRYPRRTVLKGMIAGALCVLAATTLGLRPAAATMIAAARSSLKFQEVAHGIDRTAHVSPGHSLQTLLRWGDPVMADAPPFDPYHQTPQSQALQFGYNCDWIGFMPLPAGGNGSDHGLLCVNHEYTSARMMFPGAEAADPNKRSRQMSETEMAAHGHSVVEIVLDNASGDWVPVLGGPYNRRLTAWNTPIRLGGPVAGHPRVRTSADPSGVNVIGTLNNCAGGKTPWNTVLIAEENIHGYFGGDPAKAGSEAGNHARMGIAGRSWYAWHHHHDRFNVEREPNEPNRFGWVVEFDPYNPESVPVKRTAMGRFKHEGATTVLAPDRRVVVYMGDDEAFEYLYRFVSARPYLPSGGGRKAANAKLLDEGVLSVARFETDGTLTWLPLVFGTGPLDASNGFFSQVDVLIETRRAADLLGATPMDRPEDVEPNPVNGRVYVSLTKNKDRDAARIGPANPRADNRHGHILELVPPIDRNGQADHSAQRFDWNVFVLAGNPGDPADGARYGPGVTADGWLSNPDNLAVDSRGRLWIATDGAEASGFADGLWGCDTEGPGRALTRHFYRVPVGAELCGPEFTPGDTTLFVAVQHPGDAFGAGFDAPATRWPDFDPKMPPRPSVQAIRRKDGRPIT